MVTEIDLTEDIEFVEDTERIKVLLEDTRLNILSLLKIDNMSISQISDSLEKDRSTVYRHIKKLEEWGFVELKGERIDNNVPEMLYGRTANLFLPCPRSMDADKISKKGLSWDIPGAKKILEIMDEIGYKNEKQDELAKEFNQLFSKVNEDILDNLSQSDDIQYLTFQEQLQIKVLVILLEMESNTGIETEIDELVGHFEIP